MREKNIIDIISEPVNKQTAIVVYPSTHKGHDFPPSQRVTSLTPLPTTYFTGPKEHDLTGRRCGRFIVIGFSLWRSKDKHNASRWVCRCSCGRYELLTTKTVKSAREENRCVECRKLRRLQWRHDNPIFQTNPLNP